MSGEYGVKSIKVTIRLITSETVRGEVNMVGYTRLSDFIADNIPYLKVYNATRDGKSDRELLINKNHIIFIDMTGVGLERA